MVDVEHLAMLRQGCQVWNPWRQTHPGVQPDLSQANLDGLRLRGIYLGSADLRGVHLRWADLGGADLVSANLVGADLHGADLGGANLRGANLSAADLSHAQCYETVLVNVDLSTTQGLDTCQHLGPSSLDHRTLARSGPLPPTFLRGCGLNEWQIEATKLNWPDLSHEQFKKILYRIHEQRVAGDCGIRL